MEILQVVMICLYVYAGDKSIRYLKYHLLHVEAEIYTDTAKYITSRFIWGAILGWATIPIAAIHYLLTNKQ